MIRTWLRILTLGAAMLAAAGAAAQETVKIGVILPLTGPFAPIGRQAEVGMRLYMQEHGDTVAGKTIELIVEDDASNADNTKRLAQELVVRQGANVLAGFGLTPLALAAAPIAQQAKIPMVVTCAATAIITTKSDYIARTSFTLPQATSVMADWAAKNGIKTVAVLVSDYAPGNDAAASFQQVFTAAGGQVVEELKVPLQNPDFSPFLQRAKDAAPDALFVFVPAGQSAAFMKQFADRGLREAGIKLIGTGDVTDDEVLDQMGDVALGAITAHHYSVAHDTPENKAFVAGFSALHNGARPNFMGVGGYDGMQLIYRALEKTGGDVDGTKLIDAMKGLSWESPRGPVTIDPETRDIVQDIYIREVKSVDGALFNVEFAKVSQVKDPVKAAAP
jgi:branched-chain amino acid transport system substrate-binding protein